MLRGIVAGLCFFIAGLLCLNPPSRAQLTMTGVGGGFGSSVYFGPGNIVSGSSAWYSCAYAYSAAYAAGLGNACDLVDAATGMTAYTLKALSNGKTDAAGAFASSACAVACKVTKIYDQSGGGVHATQATLAAMPVLTASVLASQPCMTFSGGQSLVSSAITGNSQPFTMSGVFERVGSAVGGVFQGTGGTTGLIFVGADTLDLFAGALAPTTGIADNSFHAVQGVFNGGSSVLYVDGASNSPGDPGASNADPALEIGQLNGGFLTGIVCEIGLWVSAFNGTQQSNMNSNQHTRYAF